MLLSCAAASRAPPPHSGSRPQATVRNDTAAAAEVFGGLTDGCTHGYDAVTLAPGKGDELFNEDMYEPMDIGVAGPAHACPARLPHSAEHVLDRPAAAHDRRGRDAAAPCPGVPAGQHPVVRFDSQQGG
jgi:hypothetical protein